MKKLFIALIAIVFASCSQDQVESVNPVAETSLSVLDGKMLSFKDDKSFIKEYSALSELKSTKEIQGWISKKGHLALLNSLDTSEGIQDSIVSKDRIIYSDALKSIVNSDFEFKVGGKVLWLNERNLYVLTKKDQNKNLQELIVVKNNLEVYGRISNLNANQKSNITNRDVIPNENRIITFVKNLSSGRYVLDLFNETIVVNDQIFSSKMYLRYTLQYRSCSFWRCTWKTDTTNAWYVNGGPGSTLTSTVIGNNDGFAPWTMHYLDSSIKYGQYTFLLATWGTRAPMINLYDNFQVSGYVDWSFASGGSYPQTIYWY